MPTKERRAHEAKKGAEASAKRHAQGLPFDKVGEQPNGRPLFDLICLCSYLVSFDLSGPGFDLILSSFFFSVAPFDLI